MKNIYYFIISMVLLSCTPSSYKEKKLQDLSQKPIELNGTLLQCDSTIWSTNIVESIDDKIITIIYSLDNIFQIYQLNQDEIKAIGSFGKEGNGPKEFPVAADCYYDSYKKWLYIFSRNSNIIKCYKANLSSTENLYNPDTWETINIKCAEQSGYFWKRMIPLSDSLYIAVGGDYNEDNLLSILNLKTNRVEKINVQYPDDKNNSSHLIKRSVYRDGLLLKKPNSNQFLYCCSNWGNYAEIINLDNQNKFVNSKILARDYPLYKTAADGINAESLNNTLMGMTASVTEQYIYLLPNFLTKKEYHNKEIKRDYPPNYCNILYQFNWEGDFINSYKLDKSIEHFTVDPLNRYIIGGSIDLNSGADIFIRFEIRE